MSQTAPKEHTFNSYQVILIIILACVQFTNMLDFMIVSPLGAHLSRVLKITSTQFGLVVSAYAFSATISGFISAIFVDNFDRKKFLLFFYTGFIIGTFMCGIAKTYSFLLMARILTGVFGGVISSIIFTVVTDQFQFSKRGRAIAYIQLALSASQVLGIPLGLYLTNKFSYHIPFLMISGVGTIVLIIAKIYISPFDKQTKPRGRKSYQRFLNILFVKENSRAYLTTGLLAIGGFMLMPYASIFLVHNVGISEGQLPLIYIIAGGCTIVTGPLAGKLSDKYGKVKTFAGGSFMAIVMVLTYTNLSSSPILAVIIIYSLLYIAVSSRLISGMALITAVPSQADRGSFMSINSSFQQLAGGIAATTGGLITYQNSYGRLMNYNILGVVITALVIISVFLVNKISKGLTPERF